VPTDRRRNVGDKAVSKTLVGALSVIALLISYVGCHAVTKIVAERCVLVDLQQAKGKELLPYLAAFAEAHQLVAEKSDPIEPIFQRRDGEAIHAEVIYRMGMGRFGAQLALFRYDEVHTGDLPVAFDEFVDHEVSSRYKVTRCTDVPGYQLPEVYR
jgi:hypothetical protein